MPTLLGDEPPSKVKKLIILTLISLAILLFPNKAVESVFFWEAEVKHWDYGYLHMPVVLHTERTDEVLEPINHNKWYGNGSCVPYARVRSGIQLFGWARYFLEDAAKAGYATGTDPVVGSMMVTNESNGHVAVVEEVFGKEVMISEQNFKGIYIVSERTLEVYDSRIKGYIYPK